jgi:hypothetical protein
MERHPSGPQGRQQEVVEDQRPVVRLGALYVLGVQPTLGARQGEQSPAMGQNQTMLELGQAATLLEG